MMKHTNFFISGIVKNEKEIKNYKLCLSLCEHCVCVYTHIYIVSAALEVEANEVYSMLSSCSREKENKNKK